MYRNISDHIEPNDMICTIPEQQVIDEALLFHKN